MSTTFGIKIDTRTVEVAHRSNGIRWTNELAHLLPDDTEVVALDNTNQGVFTIRDIRLKIEAQRRAEAYMCLKKSRSQDNKDLGQSTII